MSALVPITRQEANRECRVEMLKWSRLQRSEHGNVRREMWAHLNISKHRNTCRDIIAMRWVYFWEYNMFIHWQARVFVLRKNDGSEWARSSHDVMQFMKYEILQCFNEFSVANWEFPPSPDGSGWAWSCFNKRAWSRLFYLRAQPLFH